ELVAWAYTKAKVQMAKLDIFPYSFITPNVVMAGKTG
ncbi:hypothetical protein APX70_05284, partial [Pseudomonas syringae pv. maculicola]